MIMWHCAEHLHKYVQCLDTWYIQTFSDTDTVLIVYQSKLYKHGAKSLSILKKKMCSGLAP